ncbi:hypothetical protein OIU76_001747 [Salix suchowensis]|nr:hypothetical protein OIU76_001747 [Salix suchowensis]
MKRSTPVLQLSFTPKITSTTFLRDGKQGGREPGVPLPVAILGRDSRIKMEMRAGEEDIEIGEDMTPSVIPLSYALHDAFLHSHCSSCFSLLPGTKFYPASPCTHAALLFLYLLLFPFLPRRPPPPPLPPSSDLRAALRLLYHYTPSSSTNRICGLLTNREKLMADEEISARVRDGAKAIEAARRIEMDENEKNEDALLEAALCLVLTNAVEVQDHEGRSLGIAVYGPNFSWINHSCSPNACYRFIISPPDNVLPFRDDSSLRILPAGTKSDNGVHNNIEFPKGCSGSGPRVIVRSIKRIKKGEEVTVAYTDLLQPKEIRRSELLGQVSFYLLLYTMQCIAPFLCRSYFAGNFCFKYGHFKLKF